MWQGPKEGEWRAIWVSREEISRQREDHLEGYNCKFKVSKARRKIKGSQTAVSVTGWIIRRKSRRLAEGR